MNREKELAVLRAMLPYPFEEWQIHWGICPRGVDFGKIGFIFTDASIEEGEYLESLLGETFEEAKANLERILRFEEERKADDFRNTKANLERKHGSVWVDCEGNLWPVKLMTENRLLNIAGFLNRKWLALLEQFKWSGSDLSLEQALAVEPDLHTDFGLLGYADRDWYPGDEAVFDSMDEYYDLQHLYAAIQETRRWIDVIKAALEERGILFNWDIRVPT